jgi:hypothetical protein
VAAAVDDCDEEETVDDIRRTHLCCADRERSSCIVARLDRSAEYPRSSCIHTNAPSPVELERVTRWLARLRPPSPSPLVVSVTPPHSAPTEPPAVVAASHDAMQIAPTAAATMTHGATLVAKLAHRPAVPIAATFASVRD